MTVWAEISQAAITAESLEARHDVVHAPELLLQCRAGSVGGSRAMV